MLAAPGLDHGQSSGAGTKRDAEEQRVVEEIHVENTGASTNVINQETAGRCTGKAACQSNL